MTPGFEPPAGVRKRYALIAGVLRLNIASGRLPAGFVLLEGPIADLLQSSRAPVQTALRMLEEEGLIRRFDGRGYLVGPPGAETPALRRDIRALDLAVSDEIDEALQSRSAWENVYDRVEEEVARSLIFGEFRIIETELGEHLGVSRTVARDVLSRLQERGLIRKNQSSHWIAGPLTARAVRDKFEIRTLLEPKALGLAAPRIDHAAVEVVLARLSDGDGPDRAALEGALFDHCIAKAPNAALVAVIAANCLLLTAADGALTRLGLPPDSTALDEYRVLFDLIARHRIAAAAEYLEGTLRIMAQRSLARLKIVAVISGASDLPTYLTPR